MAISTVELGGVHLGMSQDAYRSAPGLSHSDLKRLRMSPFHYARLREPTAPAKEPTAAMLNGTRVHCALLEPDEWPKRYAVAPETVGDKRTKSYKEFAELSAGLGLEVITQQEADKAHAQAAALRRLPQVAELLDGAGACEVSAWWRDPATNTLCKCRPDRVATVGYGKGAVLLDVKTTADASAEQFARSVHTFGYHTQAHWYCTGYALAAHVEVHGMVFACVENEYPYAPAAYMLDDDALRVAAKLNADAVASYVHCAERDEWPGYPSEIQVLSLPAWAMR